MKRLRTFALLGVSALVLLSCAKGPDLRNPQHFRTKTGVIGVFRQPAFYCSEANPHFMQLGPDSAVQVKPTWSEDQDNLFVTEQPAGKAVLRSYSYSCGGRDNKFVLDSTTPGPIGVVVPEKGFCKTVISFVQGDKLFDHNDALLEEIAKKSRVAINMSELPYCEVYDNTGAAVSFADRDSLMLEQYAAAVKDAADAMSDEIFPLVVIDSAYMNDKIAWNVDTTKVLMAVFNSTPDSFQDGASIKLEKELWAVSERELYLWYKANNAGVRNWHLRFNQLFGKPKDERLTHFSLVWVKPSDLMRPAYVTDVKSSEMKTLFEDDLDEGSDSTSSETMIWFKNWFDDQRAKSYGPKGYPWTRLGYTYDWGSTSGKYGLSEFIVLPGAEVEVRFTKNMKSFLQWLNDRKN